MISYIRLYRFSRRAVSAVQRSKVLLNYSAHGTLCVYGSAKRLCCLSCSSHAEPVPAARRRPAGITSDALA